jgi:proline iminopeptidase
MQNERMMLDVGDGHSMYYECHGDPSGKPVVVLHGGPGSGTTPDFCFMFDLDRYHVVLYDQRNCGRSTPHASQPDVDVSTNTTHDLVADIERLRSHLGLDQWMVWGGSWGTTLGLAYAETHPERVTDVILVNVGNTTRREVEWITHDMGRIFPEQWQRFRDVAGTDHDIAAAYARLLFDDDPAVRDRAAQAWCDWEDTHVATYAGHQHDARYDDPRFRLCFARIVTHYWSNAAFLEDGQLLRDAPKLAGIPGVLINGRLDISGPPDIAWKLAQRWPDAELVLTDNAGHGAAQPTTFAAIVAATARFAG